MESRFRYPMVVALFALLIGVIISLALDIEVWISTTLLSISLLGAALTRYQWLVVISLVALGMTLSSVQSVGVEPRREESNPSTSLIDSINENLHSGASSRLERLPLSSHAAALCQATTLGSRDKMSQSVKALYRESGVQHLLAISGLHLSIVVLFCWIVTSPLLLLTHGQVWRSVAIIVMLWSFVLSTTMPISVMRSAIMLSTLTASIGVGGHYNSLNTLSAVAFLMTLFNVRIIFDVGFQLSFVSVAAILLFSEQIYALCRGLPMIVKLPLEALLVGAVATLAITPIVSSVFGYISPLSPIATLPLLPLLYLMVVTTLLWIILPIAPLEGIATTLLEWSAASQIYITSAASGWRLSQVEYSMSGWSVVLFYLLLFVIYPLFVGKYEKK